MELSEEDKTRSSFNGKINRGEALNRWKFLYILIIINRVQSIEIRKLF